MVISLLHPVVGAMFRHFNQLTGKRVINVKGMCNVRVKLSKICLKLQSYVDFCRQITLPPGSNQGNTIKGLPQDFGIFFIPLMTHLSLQKKESSKTTGKWELKPRICAMGETN